MTESDSAHWSDYWACGHVTSLPQDFAGNYDGEIRAFWEDRFAATPPHAQVLDLCTGNGAVALLAAAWSRANGAAFEVTGLDAAKLDPAALARLHPRSAHLLRAVRFIGDSPLENCRLPDAAFDLVTSQYGIEYCHPDHAARQVSRLLKPGGLFAMLTHEPSSEILSTMGAEHDEYRLLDEAGLFETLDQAVSVRFEPRVMQSRLAALDATLSSAEQSPLYANVLRLVQFMRSLDEAGFSTQRAALGRARDQLHHAMARLEDMLRVNRMIADDPEWHRVFERHGLIAGESGEILYRGRHRSGRYHCYRKPANPE